MGIYLLLILRIRFDLIMFSSGTISTMIKAQPTRRKAEAIPAGAIIVLDCEGRTKYIIKR